MAKQMHLIAFTHHAASSQSFGQWVDPANTMARGYLDPDYWVRFARTCERGCFDAMFFADAPGAKDIYGGDHRMTAKSGMQFPANDPTFLPPVLARETAHLGFIVTFATSYFQPFHTARMFSTLDHMTRGRVGWNIVTGYLSAALRNGMGAEMPHDERYERAEEFMDVVYKLWEQSWTDDAVVLDRASRTYADPDRVRRIDHHGRYFSVQGPHASEPSPQRTPLLAQAGGSPRGVGGEGGKVGLGVEPLVKRGEHRLTVRIVPINVKTKRTGYGGTLRGMEETPGDRLRRARITAGFRGPAEAAARHHWNVNTYKSHENGMRGFKVATARQYAKAFGVSHVWLLTGIEPTAGIDDDEADLLADYRAMDAPTRNQARALLRALIRSGRETA